MTTLKWELIYDQSNLFKNAKKIVTSLDKIPDDDFIFVQVEKSKTPDQIRKDYLRSNLDPFDKAIEKGSFYVRKYFNDKNLRKRSSLN